MFTRIFLNIKDIMIITGHCRTQASKEMRYLRTCLDKLPHHKLTIDEYCRHYGIDKSTVIEILSKVSH